MTKTEFSFFLLQHELVLPTGATNWRYPLARNEQIVKTGITLYGITLGWLFRSRLVKQQQHIFSLHFLKTICTFFFFKKDLILQNYSLLEKETQICTKKKGTSFC